MIRQPGMKPKLESRNRPGRSFRRERSPVAPKRVITCGYLGPTPDAIFVTAQILTSTTRTVKTRNPTPAESNQREWRNLPRHRQLLQAAVPSADSRGGLSDAGRMGKAHRQPAP